MATMAENKPGYCGESLNLSGLLSGGLWFGSGAGLALSRMASGHPGGATKETVGRSL